MSGGYWVVISDVREWSGGPPVCPSLVVSPSRVVERHSQCPGVVRRPLWMYESGLEALLKVR